MPSWSRAPAPSRRAARHPDSDQSSNNSPITREGEAPLSRVPPPSTNEQTRSGAIRAESYTSAHSPLSSRSAQRRGASDERAPGPRRRFRSEVDPAPGSCGRLSWCRSASRTHVDTDSQTQLVSQSPSQRQRGPRAAAVEPLETSCPSQSAEKRCGRRLVHRVEREGR